VHRRATVPWRQSHQSWLQWHARGNRANALVRVHWACSHSQRAHLTHLAHMLLELCSEDGALSC